MMQKQDPIIHLQNQYAHQFDEELHKATGKSKTSNLEIVIEGITEISNILPNLIFVGLESETNDETRTYKPSNPISDEQLYLSEAIKVQKRMKYLNSKKDSEKIGKLNQIIEYYKTQYINAKIIKVNK